MALLSHLAESTRRLPGPGAARGRRLPLLGRALVAGHVGELLQGVFEGEDGRLHRGLLTLPDPTYCAKAVFVLDAAAADVMVNPPGKSKAARAARLTLEALGAAGVGGTLTLTSSFPSGAAGWGLGTSTADVTAGIEAVARAFGRSLSPARAAHLAVRAEVAADPLAFGPRAVLFAQREGVVLEDFGTLPALLGVGFDTDPRGVDTLAFPPARYDWHEIEAFRVLRASARRAVRTGDAPLLARVATASARINQRHLALRCFERLLRLVEEIGGLGLTVSHSGTAAALLLDVEDARILEQLLEARKVLTGLGCSPTWVFQVGADAGAEGIEDEGGSLP